MKFADGKCYLCGAEFGEKKPKKVTEVSKPYTTPFGRLVQFVAPCPSCGKDVPLWDPGEPEVPAEPVAPTEE